MRVCNRDLFYRERREEGGGAFECTFKSGYKNGN